MNTNQSQAQSDNITHLRVFYVDRAKEALDACDNDNFKDAILMLAKFCNSIELEVLKAGLAVQAKPSIGYNRAMYALDVIKENV